MKSKLLPALVVFGGAALLPGCAHEPTKVAPPPQATQPFAEAPPVEVTLKETRIKTVEPALKAGPNLLDSIYFDFDSDVLRDDAQRILLYNRSHLQPDATLTIRLEGNCDERGSREYNLALGDHRAQSVRRRLVLLGVQESQLETVSFGKELPRALGHDETAWAENRRVDFAIESP